MRLGPVDGNFNDQASSSGDARPDGGVGGRQFRNQAGQLAGDAREFRNQLQASGGSRQDLQVVDEVIRALGTLANQLESGEYEGLNDLTAAALDKLKKLEFDIRQRTDKSSNQLYVAGADEAPSQYRAMVNDYFSSLSRGSTVGARTGAPAAGSR
jgi:hypothetical protein